MTEIRYGSATDVGLVRANNQDQLLVAAPLFAVADGMGGHAAGEVASLTAVQALEAAFGQHPGPEGLRTAAEEANRAVWDLAQTHGELRGMGTTLVALAVIETADDTELAVINIGDSRLYRLKDGELEQLTRDHSLVQELVDEGQLSEQAALVHPQRHVLTRALGVDPDVTADLLEVRPGDGDRFLLCSDGLPREVADNQIASILRRITDPQEAASALVHEAKSRGGNDNITVVIVDVVGGAGQPGTAATSTATGSPRQAAPAIIALADASPAEADATLVNVGLATRIGGDAAEPSLPIVDEHAAVATASRPPAAGRGRRNRRDTPAKSRALTLRVIGFLVLILAVLGVAVVAVGWYARGDYFVGLQGKTLTIFKGRPGGLLWFEPTVAEHTGVTTSQVLKVHLDDLRSGKEEASLGAARTYVTNLTKEAKAARAARKPVTVPSVPTTTTTTLPASTVPPTTLPGTTLPGTTLPGTTLPGATPPATTLPATTPPTTTVTP